MKILCVSQKSVKFGFMRCSLYMFFFHCVRLHSIRPIPRLSMVFECFVLLSFTCVTSASAPSIRSLASLFFFSIAVLNLVYLHGSCELLTTGRFQSFWMAIAFLKPSFVTSKRIQCGAFKYRVCKFERIKSTLVAPLRHVMTSSARQWRQLQQSLYCVVFAPSYLMSPFFCRFYLSALRWLFWWWCRWRFIVWKLFSFWWWLSCIAIRETGVTLAPTTTHTPLSFTTQTASILHRSFLPPAQTQIATTWAAWSAPLHCSYLCIMCASRQSCSLNSLWKYM